MVESEVDTIGTSLLRLVDPPFHRRVTDVGARALPGTVSSSASSHTREKEITSVFSKSSNQKCPLNLQFNTRRKYDLEIVQQ
jgi:hypothetical protein